MIGPAECTSGRTLSVVYLDHCAALSGAEIALARLLPALTPVDARVILGEDGPLVARLTAAGVDVRVQALSDAAAHVRRDEVQVGRLPLRTVWETVRYVLALTRQLRRLRPDLVHTNSLKANLYGGLAGRLAGVPVVWHARDRISGDYLPEPVARVVRRAARWLPSAIIANSQATLDTLHLPAPVLARAAVIGDPYRPPAPPSAAPVSTDAASGTPPLVVGMVGRLAPWKGQDVLLRALAELGPRDDVRAVLVGSALFGEDAYEVELRQLVVDLGLAGRVELLGFRDDVEAELAQLDILVHASVTPEPFGQVIVEGLAAGLPVVVSGAGGAAEIVQDGVTGLLHPPGDVSALAVQLGRLLDEPDLRSRLGAAGRVRAQHFHPEIIAAAVLESYGRLLASPRRRARRDPSSHSS